MSDTKNKEQSLRDAALEYHRRGQPGKVSLAPTKSLATPRDLALAYSPGVAAPCEEIAADPAKAYEYTARGNVVAVITNGTAVLGLGNIGALASKPVMEGKAVLFKKFADIDAVDIELDETDIDKFCDAVAALEPSFGGINLEDIKAPECFEIEKRLKDRMAIPVFHDDQHGTAIIVGAAFTNWLRLSGRKIKKVKLVASGAGASAIACLNLLVSLGVPRENITVCDRVGVLYKGREEGMDPYKEKFAADTKDRTLEQAIKGADVFLGLSGPNVLDKSMVKSMANAPLIMALANPTPEIMPEDAREAKPNAVICTGRSDYPNQVNNVLGFPFLFRGALDVSATTINEDMKLACVKAIADLTMAEATAEVASVYGDAAALEFGPDYLIPKPLDPRLIIELPIAVAKAAVESGVATRPIEDWDAYRQKLEQNVFKTGMVMRPIFAEAHRLQKRVAFCEGEEPRVLRAAQVLVDDGIAKPILIGREEVVNYRIKKFNLRLEKDRDFELVNPQSDPRYDDYCATYHNMMARNGISPGTAKIHVRTRTTVIGALLVHKGHADAAICGTMGRYRVHYQDVKNIIGTREGVKDLSAMNVLVLPSGTYFITDTYVNEDPTAEQLCETTILAAKQIEQFGIKPNIALISHSDFGTHDNPSARKMKRAVELIKATAPELSVDGEMHADCALDQEIRDLIYPESSLRGAANLLVMPNIDAANISFNMIKMLGNGIVIGPLLLGTRAPVHVLTPSVTARGLINAAALACVQAGQLEDQKKAGKNKSKKNIIRLRE